MVDGVDPVPLGVSGSVTIALRDYLARIDSGPRPAILVEDTQRIEYISRRIAAAIDRPLTAPGSQQVARQVTDYFTSVDLISHFATKVLETLRDGNLHDRTFISAAAPRLAISFISWNGTHREVQAERVGNYLGSLLNTGRVLASKGISITGLLEIDAYVRENVVPDNPALSLEDVFEVDLEYSYIPGFLLGNPSEKGPLPPMVLFNPDLCSPDEVQLLRRFVAR